MRSHCNTRSAAFYRAARPTSGWDPRGRLAALACCGAALLVVISSPLRLRGDEPAAAARPRFELEWGSYGSRPGEFDFPIGIALAPDGEVVVTDFYNARVQRFTPLGEYVASFAVLPNPGGIAIDAEGHIFLSHFSAMRRDEEKKPDRITVYDPLGRFVRTWGATGTGPGEFDFPGGIAISPQGRVYVADQTNRRVQVFDREGTFLFQWGQYGVAEGQFGGNVTPTSRVGGPQFIAIDTAGDVFTTEGSMARVQQFTPDGRFVRAWGSGDDRPGGFGGSIAEAHGLAGPVALCFDAQQHLWVTCVSGRIQRFTREGTFLALAGRGAGSEPGEFRAPHGIASDGRGHLFVVDSFNHRVQKFAIGP